MKFPGSTLGSALGAPVALTGGGKDLYIQQAKFHDQFAADVSAKEAHAMAAGQRPVTEAERAKSKGTEVVPGASHAVMVSNPEAVAKMIEQAATT